MPEVTVPEEMTMPYVLTVPVVWVIAGSVILAPLKLRVPANVSWTRAPAEERLKPI